MEEIKADTQFVTMGIDREVFAINVDAVREILDARQISRLPNAPAALLGLIDVRGQAVPVMDLRVKLGLPPAAATEHTRIVVLDIELDKGSLLLGLLADRVFEVTGLTDGTVTPPPEIGVRWRSQYIQGIGRRGQDFVIVFDLAHLLTAEDVALLDGRSAA